ncbi:MAG: corrinoid protein [Actinomycetota bacterium]|nr:corrinoid protein [Actinomycetota bacterium]
MGKDELLARIEINVIQGRRNGEDEGLDEDLAGTPGVSELVEQALEEGIKAKNILLGALSTGMNQVGDKYESGEYFLPDMLTAAEAVGAAMEILEPHLLSSGVESKGRVVLATVKGDLHDIGKNIVGLMLKGAGYDVVDLGADVDSGMIIEELKRNDSDLLGLSALLTTTMAEMGKVLGDLDREGMRDGIRIMVGGAPLSEQFAEEIGADAYGRDAIAAVKIADSLVSDT